MQEEDFEKGDAELQAGEAIDADKQQLEHLGYKQQLHRSLGVLENFASSFCANNCIACVRAIFFLGLLAGGPLAMWSSLLINDVFMWITAAILAEICSSLPISGSIYIWAACAAGVKYGRFVGFIVAWWIAAAWMAITAGATQALANYVLPLLIVYEVDFPGGVSNDNVKCRALVWIIAESILALAVLLNYLSPRRFTIVFRGAMMMMLLDFILCVVWLPIGVSNTYGFRSAHEAFLTTNNGTGAPPGWNRSLSFFFAASTLVGFEAAGHIAEETKNASSVAARNIFKSAVLTGVGAFTTTILFLFCTPDIKTLLSLNAPQPFVLIWSKALGRGGSVFMTLLVVLEGILSIAIIVLAASRLIFAIARDGALPFSSWVGKVTPQGRPKNAVTFVFGFCALLLCTGLPSTSAFTSLISAGDAPVIASYGLIAFLRLTVTPNGFRSTKFSLGRFRKVFYALSFVYNGFLFAVFVSPFTFPVSVRSMNFASIVFCGITIFGVLSFWLTPEEKWLSREQIQRMYDGADDVSGR